MGMIFYIKPVSEPIIDSLLDDPETIHDVLEQLEDEGEDLDKSWHAIHYLLTGSVWEGEGPQASLLQGGELVGEEEVGYGPARVMRPAQVKAFADVLGRIRESDLRQRYDPDAMQQADIYPTVWDREEAREENWRYIWEYFELLRQTVQRASAANEGLILLVM